MQPEARNLNSSEYSSAFCIYTLITIFYRTLYAIRNGAGRCRPPLDTGACPPGRANTFDHSLTPLRFVRMAGPVRHSTDSAPQPRGIDLDAFPSPTPQPVLAPAPRLSPGINQPAEVLLFPHPMLCIFPTTWSGPPGPSERPLPPSRPLCPPQSPSSHSSLVTAHRAPWHAGEKAPT